jgi:hypothetical protein
MVAQIHRESLHRPISPRKISKSVTIEEQHFSVLTLSDEPIWKRWKLWSERLLGQPSREASIHNWFCSNSEFRSTFMQEERNFQRFVKLKKSFSSWVVGNEQITPITNQLHFVIRSGIEGLSGEFAILQIRSNRTTSIRSPVCSRSITFSSSNKSGKQTIFDYLDHDSDRDQRSLFVAHFPSNFCWSYVPYFRNWSRKSCEEISYSSLARSLKSPRG